MKFSSWIRWLPGMACLLCLLACHATQTMTLSMVGQGYEWYIHYPDSGGGTGTDHVVVKKDVYVPENTDLKIHLTSKDYIYALKIPAFGQNEMAVPDIAFDLTFNTGPPGKHPLKGDQMCGYTHDTLRGELVVLSRADFEKWLAAQPAGAAASTANAGHH